MGVKVYIGGGATRGLHSSPQAAVWCRGNMNWSRLVSKISHFLSIFLGQKNIDFLVIL